NLNCPPPASDDLRYRSASLHRNACAIAPRQCSAIGSIPAAGEDFSYDATGTWTDYTASAEGTVTIDQSRVNNRDNQLTQIDASNDGISYDKAGNATRMVPDASGDWDKSYQLKWDGWNRLVEVRDETGSLVAAY